MDCVAAHRRNLFIVFLEHNVIVVSDAKYAKTTFRYTLEQLVTNKYVPL